ncbi:5-(carboxyamino)imidazole ribonucleotide synthase [Ignavigranum ruoffiae]|uniref:5-(carboxyamino)imidazole ribonucleotide synthase n=1 Tax=Ignavigranum ruoffiae TaxID=89093 RepID=UPI00206858F2|nr:5-(carboxyamino)imidazole ribonucleotide synthase [Ignavigranum ruoffiae]UPQ85634.1 5-(carboxyamino)imidazole ribonucleotide synthase [Ignavigranum ruoffiae]
MSKRLLPGQSVGIIGAGQLGKMLAQSGQKMGYRLGVYDPNSQACAFPLAHWKQAASFDDETAVLNFAKEADVITYEFENINGQILENLAQTNKLPQGTDLLIHSQHRLMEKEWLESIGVKVVPFRKAENWDQLQQGIEDLSYPVIIKTSRFGYDGKGQFRLISPADLEQNEADLKAIMNEQSCIIEAYCPFAYEISVMVSRDQAGQVELFPISENDHQAGVLFSSLVGKTYPVAVTQAVHEAATKIAQAGKLVGVCGVEFFVTEDHQVLVNEIAPRPHNSGHYSIEACNFSQFDQHILAVTGRSIQPIKLLQAALMINIMGQHMSMLDEIIDHFPQAMVHIYDKGQAKFQRKMGHFTLLAEDIESLETLLQTDQLLLTMKSMYHKEK